MTPTPPPKPKRPYSPPTLFIYGTVRHLTQQLGALSSTTDGIVKTS